MNTEDQITLSVNKEISVIRNLKVILKNQGKLH